MKQKLITLSSPVAVRDTKQHITYLTNVVEGYATESRRNTSDLRVHKVYDNSIKAMVTLAETCTIEVKSTNVRSIQEL